MVPREALIAPEVLASWQAWFALRLTRVREALLLVMQYQHLDAQMLEFTPCDELREFSAALCAHLDIPLKPVRRIDIMSDVPIDPIPLPPRDLALSASQLLDSLSGEQLGVALIRAGMPLPALRDQLAAHADDLERALHAVRRLRESAGDDPAELRVNLLELRNQLAKIEATDEELASCIR